MMNPFEKLHQQPHMCVIYTTGAGVGMVPLLWEFPGASNTILEGQVLYGRGSLIDRLGTEPSKYVSMETAIMMADAAYRRALELAAKEGRTVPVIGVGGTGAVATNRERRGKDEFFAAARSSQGTWTVHVEFPKGSYDRELEGKMCDMVGASVLLVSAGVVLEFADNKMKYTLEIGVETTYEFIPHWTTQLDKNTIFDQPLFYGNGRRGLASDLSPETSILFPGSFNPLHFGHQGMADLVKNMTGKTPIFWITASHPDKGTIPNEELVQRITQFDGHQLLVTEGGSLYYDKAKMFPGHAFLLGADAVLGLIDPKYYGGDTGLNLVLTNFRMLGTKFYVVGREVNGVYLDPDSIPYPEGFRTLFIPVSGRWNISSTQLRNQK